MNYTDCYLEKINFVKELKEVVIKYQHNITDIHYDVFVNAEGRAEEEYLVVEYKGGAKTARNSFANNCAAIFKDLSEYLNHCYYYEIENYKRAQDNSNLKLLEI